MRRLANEPMVSQTDIMLIRLLEELTVLIVKFDCAICCDMFLLDEVKRFYFDLI